MQSTGKKQQEVVDRQMMARAILLAGKGLYTTSPNPRVGCVICKNNEIIAESGNAPIAQKDPSAHAEIQVLRAAGT